MKPGLDMRPARLAPPSIPRRERGGGGRGGGGGGRERERERERERGMNER